MPINLSKGQKVDLTKKNPGLKKIMVGLGWDVNAFDSGSDFDLDAAAFMLGANGKCPTEKEFIFYGNLKHASESVIHMGDNLIGCLVKILNSYQVWSCIAKRIRQYGRKNICQLV